MRISFPRSALLLLASGWTCPYRNHLGRPEVSVRESPLPRRGTGRVGNP